MLQFFLNSGLAGI